MSRVNFFDSKGAKEKTVADVYHIMSNLIFSPYHQTTFFLSIAIITTPPTSRTAPSIGGQLTWCVFSLFISMGPASMIFSLVLKLKPVKIIISNPIIANTIPVVFIF